MNDFAKIEALARNLLKAINNCTADIEKLKLLKTILSMGLTLSSHDNVPLSILTYQKTNVCWRPHRAKPQRRLGSYWESRLQLLKPIAKPLNKNSGAPLSRKPYLLACAAKVDY